MLVSRVVKLAALRTSKALALLKIQLQKQPAWFAFKSAFRYFPSRFELQGRRKQCFRCHRPLFPLRGDLQGPAMRPLFLICRAPPRATLKITSYALTHSQQREADFWLKAGRKVGLAAAHIGISFSTEPKADRQLVYLGLRQNETSGLTHVATVEGGVASAETWLGAYAVRAWACDARRRSQQRIGVRRFGRIDKGACELQSVNTWSIG